MNETAETAAQVSDQLYQAVLNRMNITWEPDEKTERNTKNAIEEALDYLRDTAGSPGKLPAAWALRCAAKWKRNGGLLSD